MKTAALLTLGLSLAALPSTAAAAPITSLVNSAGQTVDLPALGVSFTVPQGFKAQPGQVADGSLLEFVFTPQQASSLAMSFAVLPGSTETALEAAFPKTLTTPFGAAQLGTPVTRSESKMIGPFATGTYALEDNY